MRKQKGFSLIELLIVVAIILIIAAIAIPNLLRSRMAANEASAVGSIRSINTAEMTYATTYPAIGFTNLTALGNAGATTACTPSVTTACIVDNVLGAGTKSGFTFATTLLPAAATGQPQINFQVTGDPQTFGTSGMRHFFSDESFVIRYDTTTAGPATATSQALQ